MRHQQDFEAGLRFGRRYLAVPFTVIGFGLGLLTSGCENGDEETPGNDIPVATVQAAGTTATHSIIEPTITGRIETLRGEPVIAKDNPFGSATGEYRDKSEVQIICQGPGSEAPGNPADFGKPPMSDTTWYRLGDPVSKRPYNPERWIPQNPVFTNHPIPSCPR